MPGMSRTRLKALVLEGQVTMGRPRHDDPGRKLEAGAHIVVHVPPPVPAEPEGEDIPLAIVYEDDDLIVSTSRPGSSCIPPPATRPARWSMR